MVTVNRQERYNLHWNKETIKKVTWTNGKYKHKKVITENYQLSNWVSESLQKTNEQKPNHK